VTDRSVDVTDGDLFRPLLVLSAPIVASQVLQVAYNLADTFWVGRIGADAVSFVASALTTGAWFLRGTWTDNVVDPEDVDAPGDVDVAD